jgi:hypothetical protein
MAGMLERVRPIACWSSAMYLTDGEGGWFSVGALAAVEHPVIRIRLTQQTHRMVFRTPRIVIV